MATVYYIGLDVHKDSVSMAVMESGSTETVYEGKLANDNAVLVKKAKEFALKGTVVAAYEAGCLGYVIQRAFAAAGLECKVLSASKVADQRGDKIKNDRRDARLIARMLKSGTAKGIAVPTSEDEAARDLLRVRDDARDDLERNKQRLSKFLLRLGYKWEGKSNWTVSHWKWMDGLAFAHGYDKEAYEEYRAAVKALELRVGRLDSRVREVADSERYRKRVAKLMSFKGIGYLTALALVCEIGDFRRFGSAGHFMSYLGFVPSESSSGRKTSRGGITKAGNGHIRRLLTESAWHYAPSGRLGAAQKGRLEERPASESVIAAKALQRLHGKFVRLVLVKGKPKNVAITAVARELAGFIWAMETGCPN